MSDLDSKFSKEPKFHSTSTYVQKCVAKIIKSSGILLKMSGNSAKCVTMSDKPTVLSGKSAKCVTMHDKPTVQAKNELKYPKYAAVGRYA